MPKERCVMNNMIEKLTASAREEIEKWDETFRRNMYNWDNPPKNYMEYGEILEYLDVASLKNYFERVTKNRIPYDEKDKFAYVVRSEDGEIAAFTLFVLHKREEVNRDMFVQSIVTNPKYRHMGYAKYLLGTIFANPIEHMGLKPIDVAGLVDVCNKKSLGLFDKFGEFEKRRYGKYMYCILKDYKTIEQNLNQNLNI